MIDAPRRLRVAMYVANSCRADVRVLREADVLAAAGHQVTIVAFLRAGSPLPVDERRPSGVRLVRIAGDPRLRARWPDELAWIRYPWRPRGAVARGIRRELRRRPIGWLRLGAYAAGLLLALPWVLYRYAGWRVFGDRLPAPGPGGRLDHVERWRRANRPWARDAAAAAGTGIDVHHGHDLPGLLAAVEAARAGGLVVYDSHELYVESGSHARQGRLVKAWLGRLETRLAANAVALVTVNETLAAVLGARLRLARRTVVHNAPPRWTPPEPPPDLLRARLDLPPGARIVLYHGGLAENRGLRELLDAVLRPGMDDTHLVFLGGGPLRSELATRAAEPRAGGRVHLLDAVPPDQLAEWVASADVGAMPNQPVAANERLSTPNKLFESIAVGLPVVSSDFPERRRIIVEDPDGPLGAVCDPTDPAAIAAAIRSILDLGPAGRADLRARVLRAARIRWNWETEGAKLVRLYEALAAELAR